MACVEGLPDLRVTIEDLLEEDDRVVTRRRAQVMHQGELMGAAASGNQVTVRSITMARVAGGRIVKE